MILPREVIVQGFSSVGRHGRRERGARGTGGGDGARGPDLAYEVLRRSGARPCRLDGAHVLELVGGDLRRRRGERGRSARSSDAYRPVARGTRGDARPRRSLYAVLVVTASPTRRAP
jgi:hypothetical protein